MARYFLVAVLLLAFCGEGAVAQDTANLLEVRDIQVDVTDTSAAAARDKALAGGERLAYEKLIARLAEPADIARLSSVSNAEISALVKDFWITNEKTSAVRYVATFNYTFYRDRVYDHLQTKSGRVPTLAAEPMLVIPVYDQPSGAVLWEAANPWRTAWSAAAPTSVLPMRIPAGDPTDQVLLSGDQARALDAEAVRRLANRYAARTALIAVARPKDSDDAELAAITIETARLPAVPPPLPFAEYTRGDNETEAEFLRRAAESTIVALETAWKQTASSNDGARQMLPVVVPVRAFDDWHAVRRRLTATPTVENVTIIILSRQEVRANLSFFGEIETFRAALQGSGLTLNEVDGQWTLTDSSRVVPPTTGGAIQ